VQPAETERAQAALDANETSDAIVDLVHLEIDGLHELNDLLTSKRIVRATSHLPARRGADGEPYRIA